MYQNTFNHFCRFIYLYINLGTLSRFLWCAVDKPKKSTQQPANQANQINHTEQVLCDKLKAGSSKMRWQRHELLSEFIIPYHPSYHWSFIHILIQRHVGFSLHDLVLQVLIFTIRMAYLVLTFNKSIFLKKKIHLKW